MFLLGFLHQRVPPLTKSWIRSGSFWEKESRIKDLHRRNSASHTQSGSKPPFLSEMTNSCDTKTRLGVSLFRHKNTRDVTNNRALTSSQKKREFSVAILPPFQNVRKTFSNHRERVKLNARSEQSGRCSKPADSCWSIKPPSVPTPSERRKVPPTPTLFSLHL